MIGPSTRLHGGDSNDLEGLGFRGKMPFDVPSGPHQFLQVSDFSSFMSLDFVFFLKTKKPLFADLNYFANV